MKYRWWSWL